jgi:hypothetical protein
VSAKKNETGMWTFFSPLYSLFFLVIGSSDWIVGRWDLGAKPNHPVLQMPIDLPGVFVPGAAVSRKGQLHRHLL